MTSPFGRLETLSFSDIFLSSDPDEPILALSLPAEILTEGQRKRPRTPHPVPEVYRQDGLSLLGTVEQVWARERFAPEFSVQYDGVSYRCSRIIAPTDSDLAEGSAPAEGEHRHWCLRRIERKALALPDLGFPRWASDELRRVGAASGLLVVGGAFGSGKSTTAAACFLDWINQHGGIGVTLEDPPERILAGEHDGGRIYQIPIRGAGFGPAIKASRRWAYRFLYLGELRDSRAANELLQISLGGPTVITTVHAASTVEALMAISKFACTLDDSRAVHDQIAASILGVVWQRLKDGRPEIEYLSFRGRNSEAMRTKIAEGKFRLLREDQVFQNNLRALGKTEDSF